jgi:hypothetical protein
MHPPRPLIQKFLGNVKYKYKIKIILKPMNCRDDGDGAR